MKTVKIISIILILSISGCDRPSKDSLSAVSEEIKQTLSQAKQGIEQLTPKVHSLTTEEIDKLFVYEYHVVDVSRDISEGSLSQTLNQLGKERWDCFAITQGEYGQRLFLKRRPATYLRYVPRLFPVP